MQIFTGYFARIKGYLDFGLVPVAIAAKPPAGWRHPMYRKFAPSWSIWKEWHDARDSARDERYAVRFRKEILQDLEPESVRRELEEFGDNLVLCCYERPENFCHRHLVATWIAEHLEIPVVEISMQCPQCGENLRNSDFETCGVGGVSFSYQIACPVCGARGPLRPTLQDARTAYFRGDHE